MFDGRFLDMLLDGDASGMTILNDLDGSGSSPLVLAVRAENVEAVKVLIDRGAKVVLETVRSLAPTPPASVVLPAVWGGWLTAGARPLLLCVVLFGVGGVLACWQVECDAWRRRRAAQNFGQSHQGTNLTDVPQPLNLIKQTIRGVRNIGNRGFFFLE